MAYRDAPYVSTAVTQGSGLVADMVRQFADPYAFLRELVQNALDAGARTIAVRLERDAAGVMHTSVADDGTGMGRAEIEGPLLSLFASSKESDPSKIGKYGVGFVSVFAIGPRVVLVETRSATEAWLVRVHPNHHWDLVAPRLPRGARGTTVTLVQPMEGIDALEHVEHVRQALRHWCRHADVPITLTVLDGGALDPASTEVVNEPFGVPLLVSVVEHVPNARIAIGVGRQAPTEGVPTSFTGYYHRGLTLHETREAACGIAGLHVKIDSPHLVPTISRDAVKRSAELDRFLALVPAIAVGVLWPALVARSEELARAVVGDPSPEHRIAYRALVTAAQLPAFAKQDRGDLFVPLLAPVGGEVVRRLGDLGPVCWSANEPSPLAAALARAGVPVMFADAGELGAARPIAGTWTSFRTHAEGPDDTALLAEVTRLLDHLDRRVGAVRLATFDDVRPAHGHRVVPVAAARGEVLRAEPEDHAAWGRRAILLLDADDPSVRLARRRARTGPLVAAHLLVRSLLLRQGALEAEVVDRLLEVAHA